MKTTPLNLWVIEFRPAGGKWTLDRFGYIDRTAPAFVRKKDALDMAKRIRADGAEARVMRFIHQQSVQL